MFYKLIYFALLLIKLSLQVQSQLTVENHQQDQNSENIHLIGQTTINKIQYETICDCAEITHSQILDASSESCNPNKLKLQIDKQVDGGLTQEEIRDIIGDLHELKFANPKEYHFMSLDGRNTEPCLATLGGDAGEFILGLFIYEGMQQKRQLDQEAVETFLKSYLKFMKQTKFYFATDDEAIFHLERETGITLNLEILRNPNEKDKQDLLKGLIKAENQGDRHIKNLLKNSDLYSIRPEIVQIFIKAFYNILWDKSNPLSEKLFLDSLVGQPQEQAFLEIKSNEICLEKHLSPLITPRKKINNEWKSAFVNHFDAAEQKRKQLASFFADEINHHQEPIDGEIMYNRLRKHGLSFLEVSGSRLAKYLPFYTLDMV